MNGRLGGRLVVVGLLLMVPAGAASAVAAAAAPAATMAADPSLTVEDKVVLFAAGAASADGKGCVLTKVCLDS